MPAHPPIRTAELGSLPSSTGKEQSLSPIRRGLVSQELCFRERPCGTGQENQVSGAETSSRQLGPHLLQGGRTDPSDVVTNDAVVPWRQASRIQHSPDEKPPTPTQPSHGLGIKQHRTRKAAGSRSRLDNQRL